MSVKVKFLSVIVPIENIQKSKIDRGFDGLITKMENHLGKSCWYDDHLYVECAMNPNDIQSMVEQWEEYGLVSRKDIDGERKWVDLCVVDYYQGPTLGCEWLSFDPENHVVKHNPCSP